MELNGVTIEEHGSGYSVTLRYFIPGETFEGRGVEDLLKFFQQNVKQEIDDDAEAADNQGAGDAKAGSEATEASVRRPGRKGPRRAPPAGGPEGDDGGADDKPATPKAEGRRRGPPRRAGKPAAAPAREEVSEDPTDAKPAARGSRRGPKSTAAAGKTAGASKRSNKSKKAISDADLMKAVSQAAEAVGTGPVMELIEEFGVAKVQDIEQANRMEFIERARALGEED